MNSFFSSMVGRIVGGLALAAVSIIGAAIGSTYFASPDYVDQQVTYKTEELKTELVIEDHELEKALIEFKQYAEGAIQSSKQFQKDIRESVIRIEGAVAGHTKEINEIKEDHKEFEKEVRSKLY